MINRLKREVRKLKDENYELRQKLGVQTTALPKLKNRSSDSGSQTSMRSSTSSDMYDPRHDSSYVFDSIIIYKRENRIELKIFLTLEISSTVL